MTKLHFFPFLSNQTRNLRQAISEFDKESCILWAVVDILCMSLYFLDLANIVSKVCLTTRNIVHLHISHILTLLLYLNKKKWQWLQTRNLFCLTHPVDFIAVSLQICLVNCCFWNLPKLTSAVCENSRRLFKLQRLS